MVVNGILKTQSLLGAKNRELSPAGNPRTPDPFSGLPLPLEGPPSPKTLCEVPKGNFPSFGQDPVNLPPNHFVQADPENQAKLKMGAKSSYC